jgi:hypothetical protein
VSEEDRAAEAAAARAKAAKAEAARAKAARVKAARVKAARAKAAERAKRVETLGAASPAAEAVSKTKAGVPSPVAASAGDSSQTAQMILLTLFGLSALLILAALVPLSHDFVPYRFAIAWHDRRAGMAVLGGSLLVLAVVFYALLQV